MQSEQDRQRSDRSAINEINPLIFLKKKYRRRADVRSSLKDTKLLYIILFYKNEVYTERLVKFRIDGLHYYLRTSHESY